jgi:hypothetical protein
MKPALIGRFPFPLRRSIGDMNAVRVTRRIE